MDDQPAAGRPAVPGGVPGRVPGPGFDTGTYGASFADVYDEWYPDLPGAQAAVAFLAERALAGPAAPVLELGVGTGRLAIPLASRLAGHGRAVVGVDASPSMLEQLRAKPGGDEVAVTVGDMAAADPPGPFGLVFVAVNTFFNLDSETAQRRCLTNVAARLSPGGAFVIETFVADAGQDRPRDHVGISALTADRLVLTATREEPGSQTVAGQHVEMVDGGVRLRPWRIRWATVPQLDAMASDAGLSLVERYASWNLEAFSSLSAQHVSVFRA